MFFHLLKYKLIHFLHHRETLMWVFLFPILLGTFFYLGFGNLLTQHEGQEPIPIAVVSGSKTDSSQILEETIRELSKKGDDQLFEATWCSRSEAETLLQEEKVDGAILAEEEPSLLLLENGMNQTIINYFLNQYLSHVHLLEQIGREHPEQLPQAIKQLTEDTSFIQESSSDADCLVQYFYALIAMVCLYGCYLGKDAAFSLLPHLSSLGARHNTAPVHKQQMILANFLACVIANYLSVLLLFFYLIVILGIDLGSHIPETLLASLAGSVIGVSFGLFTASIGKWSKETKDGVTLFVVMLCCFLGGLMVNTMPNIIEHSAPWINRINPAVLLSDSFYNLNIAFNQELYQRNLLSMVVIAGILCVASYFLLRRKTMD